MHMVIEANNICMKAARDSRQKGAGKLLVRHRKSLGYGEGEPVPVPAEQVEEEKQRKLNWARAILDNTEGGKANTARFGLYGLVHAWPYAPEIVREAPLFKDHPE